ncbi:MAG: hypothetical protein LBM41_05715 [Ruminococcus sp.]|jgi:hypothetical protein|nr:hypothetical protein [Ruminococcus sp.]
MKIDFNEGLTFLESYARHFEKLEDYELGKLRQFHAHDIEAISAGLSSEQAFIMQTDVLEKKRIKLFGKITFEELAANAPDYLRERYEKLLKKVRSHIKQIREINDLLAVSCNERLKRIHRVTKEFEIYNDRGTVRTGYKNTNADFKV